MTVFLGIALTIFIFSLIVFVHEMGHFITARLTGMKVEEFGIGIPPKATTLGQDKKGTLYTLNWLPIGGFVRIKGEDPGTKDAYKKDAFSTKKWWARSLVLLAGVAMNFILAIVIITILFVLGVSPIFPNVFSEKDYGSYFFPTEEKSIDVGYIKYNGIEVIEVLSGGVAASAGILPGDIILKNNGVDVISNKLFIDTIHRGELLDLTIQSGNQEKQISVKPFDGKINASLLNKGGELNSEYFIKMKPYEACINAVHETYKLSLLTVDLLGSTLRKLIIPKNDLERTEAKKSLSGPIGMGVAFTSMVEQGVSMRFLFTVIALISINLGVLNILPFPALDGGRFVSTTIRSVISIFSEKRVLLDTIEYGVHAFGMIILLALSLLVALFDISKFF